MLIAYDCVYSYIFVDDNDDEKTAIKSSVSHKEG